MSILMGRAHEADVSSLRRQRHHHHHMVIFHPSMLLLALVSMPVHCMFDAKYDRRFPGPVIVFQFLFVCVAAWDDEKLATFEYFLPSMSTSTQSRVLVAAFFHRHRRHLQHTICTKTIVIIIRIKKRCPDKWTVFDVVCYSRTETTMEERPN